MFLVIATEAYACAVSVQSLVSAVISKPEAPLSSLMMLDQKSKTEIVEAFNATETAFPDSSTLHRLFEKQAALQSTRTCIVGPDRAYTYGHVDEHANQVRPLQQMATECCSADSALATLLKSRHGAQCTSDDRDGTKDVHFS